MRRYPNVRPIITVWLACVLVFAAGASLGWVRGFGQVQTTLIIATFGVVVAYGQNLVILTGGIDLSVPFTITATSIVLTQLSATVDSLAVVAIALGVATFVGLWNGVGVAFLRIPPLIMTLSTNIVLLGLVLAYTEGTPAGVAPAWLVNAMTGRIGFVPNILIIGLVFVIAGTAVLLNTSFGRYVYAIGNSREIAYLSGVRVGVVTVAVYAVAGFCSGLAGVMLSGWNEQASFDMGDPFLFASIAAVVIGGTSILGGRGSFIGTVGGVVLFTAVGTVLAATTLPQSARDIAVGGVFLVSVLLSQRVRSAE